MLRPFAHSVACCCMLLRKKPVKRLAQCWELLRPIARSFTDHRNDVKMLIPLAAFTWVLDIKPRANGHKIVGCYMLPPFAHPVTRCCVLLGVVAQFETGQTFCCVQTDAITPNPNHVASVYRGLYGIICMVYRSTDHGQLLSICLRVLPSSSSQRPETRATKWGSFLRVPDFSRTESLTLMISSPRWTPL